MSTEPSTVLAARKVICLDPTSTIAEWVLISGERITAVGQGDPPAAARVIRTEGVVLPGMIDAHVHLTATGLFGTGLDLREARSVANAIETVGRFVQSSSSQWIIGGNFDPGRNADGRMPTRQELDLVSKDVYLLVSRTDGHSCSINSATFEVLDLDPALPGIELDSRGDPTGILSNQARYEAGSRFLAKLPDAEIRRAQEAGCRIALGRGVTSVHEMSQRQRDFDVLIEGGYPIHVRPYFATLDIGTVIGAGLNCIGGDLFLDGSIGSHTAALKEPYQDEATSRGALYRSDEEIVGWMVESSRAGLQTAVHAIGDAAVEQALSCLEEAFVELGPEGALGARRLRHRIEHFEMVAPSQIERASRMGVIASVQPMFDRYWGSADGMYAQRLGDRALTMNPLSNLLRGGVTVAGGSDSTVTPLDPFLGVAAAVDHHVEEFAVSIEEGLRMFTIWAAFAAHEENDRGSIERGKKADFCVVSEDPLLLDPDEISKLPVLETWVSGERS